LGWHHQQLSLANDPNRSAAKGKCGAGMPCECQRPQDGIDEPHIGQVLDGVEVERENDAAAQYHYSDEKLAHYFSFLTPLNFFAVFSRP
jgi:hypothetical protein